jgi:hypothetical protein
MRYNNDSFPLAEKVNLKIKEPQILPSVLNPIYVFLFHTLCVRNNALFCVMMSYFV